MEIDGETVTSELTFTPESTEGTVDVEFTFNATEAAGKTLVVFESLYYGEEEIASHQDLSSPEQTLVLPSVSTTAANPELGNQTGLAKAGSIHYGCGGIYEPYCRGNLHDPRHA